MEVTLKEICCVFINNHCEWSSSPHVLRGHFLGSSAAVRILKCQRAGLLLVLLFEDYIYVNDFFFLYVIQSLLETLEGKCWLHFPARQNGCFEASVTSAAVELL